MRQLELDGLVLRGRGGGPEQEREACGRGIAVLLVSSELDELLTVADRIVVLYRGRIMGACSADPARKEAIGAMMAGQPQ